MTQLLYLFLRRAIKAPLGGGGAKGATGITMMVCVHKEALTLELGGGDTNGHSMGFGNTVVDQVDAGTKRVQQVVLTTFDLQAMLSALA